MSKNYQVRTISPGHWNGERLKTLLSEFSKRQLLVIGDVGVDRYTIGNVSRISPEAPVPVVWVQEELLKLGLAANVADNIHTLGAQASLVGIIGKDRGAADLKALLRKYKIDSRYLIADRTRKTILKDRIVSGQQQLLRVDYETPHDLPSPLEKKLLESIRERLPTADAVIIQDYAKGMLGKRLMNAIISAGKKHGKIMAVDPNQKTDVSLYEGATVLTPNTNEAEHLSGIKITDRPSLLEAGRKILRLTRARELVITRGKDGMAIFDPRKGLCELIPTYAQEVYDVSGAGDTVISVLTLALASQATLKEAAILGNLAAGLEVGKRGTATVSTEEICKAVDFFIQKG